MFPAAIAAFQQQSISQQPGKQPAAIFRRNQLHRLRLKIFWVRISIFWTHLCCLICSISAELFLLSSVEESNRVDLWVGRPDRALDLSEARERLETNSPFATNFSSASCSPPASRYSAAALNSSCRSERHLQRRSPTLPQEFGIFRYPSLIFDDLGENGLLT